MCPKERSQTMGEENCVWISLDDPIVAVIVTVSNNLPPDRCEDVKVKRSSELTSFLAPLTREDQAGVKTRSQFHQLVAVDCKLIASKYAHFAVELLDQNSLLVAVWNNEGNAKHTARLACCCPFRCWHGELFCFGLGPNGVGDSRSAATGQSRYDTILRFHVGRLVACELLQKADITKSWGVWLCTPREGTAVAIIGACLLALVNRRYSV
mmetsp:Transcript_19577/g.34580  ORF Transcript_19577/g.34580 Transcript_19577/m.34580 type:complete len:210 (+) Transcript_19577:542-1171(+)